jgi:HEPN domain-containing protein
MVRLLRSIRVARSYLRQAKARLEDAKDAVEEGNHPYAVRLSQECVELSLKAVLKAVGIEYPKIHDVSDIFPELRDRFPDWFKAEMKFLRESSKLLLKKREPSLYGDEEALVPPNGVMSRGDAEDATNRAEKTFNLCEKLIGEMETMAGRNQ